jgi:hypothetical protein
VRGLKTGQEKNSSLLDITEHRKIRENVAREERYFTACVVSTNSKLSAISKLLLTSL